MRKVIQFTVGCLFLISVFGCLQKSEEELTLSAQKAFNSGDYDAAVVNYKAAIQQNSEDADLRLAIGRTYLDIGQYQNAEKEFKKLKSLRTVEGEIDAEIARLMWHLFQLEQLEEFFETEVKVKTAEISFYGFLAYLVSDDLTQARETLSAINEFDSGNEFVLLANAYMTFVDGNTTEANALLEKTLSKETRLLPALKLKSYIAVDENDYEKAKQAIEAYTELAPYDLREQLFFADVHLQFNDTKSAFAIINPLSDSLKGNPALDQLFGHAYFIEKDYTKAKQFLERAIQNGARATRNRLIAGYTNYYLGNYEQTYNHLMSVKDEVGEDHQAIKILAIAQMKLGKTLEAAEMLKNSSVQHREEISTYTTITNRLAAGGQFALAKAVVEKVSKAPKPTPLDIIQIGLAKSTVNDPSGLEDIKNIVEANPDMIEAQMALVSVYLKNGESDALIKLAKEWQSTSGSNTALKLRAYNLEALVQENLGNMDAATQAYLTALTIDDKNIRSHVFLAKTKLDAKQYKEAATHVNQVLDTDPSNYDALLLGYNIRIAQKQYKDGLTLLSKAYKNAPDRVAVAELYAIALHAQGEFDTLFELADKSKYISENMYQVIADAHLKRNDRAKALEVYKQWDKVSPYNKVPFFHLIYLLESNAEYAEALKRIEIKTRKFPEDTSVQELHAQFLLYTGKLQDAKKLIAALKKTDSKPIVLENLEAQIPLFESKFVEALPNLLKTYETEPTGRKGYNIMLAYLGAKQHEELADFAATHLELFPADIHAQNVSANINMQLGNYPEALKGFTFLLSVIPDSPAMLNNIAWLNYKLGKMDEAETFSEQALQQLPNDPNIMDTAALIYLAKNRTDEALSLSKAAYEIVVLENSENREEITRNYILVLEKAGKTDLANQIRQRYGF